MASRIEMSIGSPVQEGVRKVRGISSISAHDHDNILLIREMERTAVAKLDPDKTRYPAYHDFAEDDFNVEGLYGREAQLVREVQKLIGRVDEMSFGFVRGGTEYFPEGVILPQIPSTPYSTDFERTKPISEYMRYRLSHTKQWLKERNRP